LLGGLLFLAGMLIMAFNVLKTIAGARGVEGAIPRLAQTHA